MIDDLLDEAKKQCATLQGNAWFPITPVHRPISAYFDGVAWGRHPTPRTTILHNDDAVRKRYFCKWPMTSEALTGRVI